MLRLIARIARELNWSRRRWSAASDQAFHQELYKNDNYDPFSLAYPGYTTIRRFADLVQPHLPERGTVVDFGCGPGEITCELAARRPDLSFIGIDHSSAAIAKAQKNIGRRKVGNVRFECRDVEEYSPAPPVALATLFDSFHHLTKPAHFVKRLDPHVKRWALIEPRGSWAGTWQKDLDFDWVAQDLDKIRAHIASLVGEKGSGAFFSPTPLKKAPDPFLASAGEAVERRYTFEDLQRFFDGHALDLRGTVAGLEAYPAGTNQENGLQERFGELRYQLYRDIDDWLHGRKLDLHAKHWLIVAERGGKSRGVELGPLHVLRVDLPGIAGPCDVKYGAYRGPRSARTRQRVMGAVELTNEGWETWSSQGEHAVFTSYHWLDAKGQIVEFDGERTPLPRAISPGETCEAAITIHTPAEAGAYRLAIDLVREGVTWFSEAGRPWLVVPFEIQ